MRKTLFAATILLASLGLNAQKGTWKVYDTRTSDICGNNISALATDGGGAWVGTFNGLCRLKGSGWMDYAMFNEKLKNQSINCLMVDKKGTLWVGTDDFGVVEFDGTNWTEHDDVTRRLKMKFVKEMVVDHDGVMWIGVTLGGLISYDGDEWEKYTPDDCGLLSDFILDLEVDRANRIWITTNAGISVYNGARWLSHTTENSGLPDNIVPAVAIDKKNVKWFGTLKGLVRYDGETWKVWNSYNSPLPGDQVNDIVIDSEGLLWIGTNEGAAVFDGQDDWAVFTSRNSQLPAGNIYKVAIDGKGDVWFGNDQKGLAKLSGFVLPGREPAKPPVNDLPTVGEAPAVADNTPATPPSKPAQTRPAHQQTPSQTVDQQPKEERVRINPSLAEGYITITMDSPKASVEFVNNAGTTIKTVPEYRAGQKISIANMPKGMYRVIISTGRTVKKIKFNLK